MLTIPILLTLLLVVILMIIYGGIGIFAAKILSTYPLAKRIPAYNEEVLARLPSPKEIWIHNPDRQKLAGWLFTAEDYAKHTHTAPPNTHTTPPASKKMAVLLQHGYRNNRSEMLIQAEFYLEAGCTVLISSLRAHDQSEGETIYFAYREAEDIHAWVEYLVHEEGFAPSAIALVGNSLGGASILHAHAKYKDGAVLVLQSVFASVQTLVTRGVTHFSGLPGWLFGKMIARLIARRIGIQLRNVRPLEWAKSVSVPILIMQGGADPIVPSDNGEQILRAVRTPAEHTHYWFEPTQAHVNFDLHHPEAYQTRVVAFVKKALTSPQPPQPLQPSPQVHPSSDVQPSPHSTPSPPPNPPS